MMAGNTSKSILPRLRVGEIMSGCGWTINDKKPKLISKWVNFKKLSEEKQEYFKGRYDGEKVTHESECGDIITEVTYFAGQDFHDTKRGNHILSEPHSHVVTYSKSDREKYGVDAEHRIHPHYLKPKVRDISKCDHPIEGCKDIESCPTCDSAIYLGRVRCVGVEGVDNYRGGTRDLEVSDDEIRLAIDQPPVPLSEGPLSWDWPKKSNGMTDRMRWRKTLETRIKRHAEHTQKLRNLEIIKEKGGGKVCRFKACNGAIHGPNEKCPTMAAIGAKGGKKKGASKARKGAKNGRAKARRSCCDTLRSKPHATTCKKARVTTRKDSPKLTLRKARKEAIKPEKIEIEWAGFAVPPSLFMGQCRTITGECGGCGESMRATKAARIHRADIQAEKTDARLICGVCL